MSLREFYEAYLCLNLKDFPNLKVDFEINKFLTIILFGIIAAIIMINYTRSAIYLTASKMIRHEAIGEENAKTLAELGLDNGRIKRCISTTSQLKAVISRVGEEKISYEEYIAREKERKKTRSKAPIIEKIDFATAKFYIKRDGVGAARELGFKSRSILLNTVLFCVLSVIIFVCLIFLMPEILRFLNNILSST